MIDTYLTTDAQGFCTPQTITTSAPVSQGTLDRWHVEAMQYLDCRKAAGLSLLGTVPRLYQID